MKKSLFVLTAVICAACTALVGCSDDPKMDAVPPSFENITIAPATPQRGDTVTATIHFLSAGKSWYHLDYTWTLRRANQEAKYYVSKSEQQTGMTEPTFTFAVPDTVGTYVLSVNLGSVQASSLFASGSPYGSASIQNSSISFNVTQ